MTTAMPEPTEGGDAARPTDSRPVLRVIRGDATPEEVAAIVAVLAALPVAAVPAPRRRPEWSARHRGVRPPHAHGPGAWRSSGLSR